MHYSRRILSEIQEKHNLCQEYGVRHKFWPTISHNGVNGGLDYELSPNTWLSIDLQSIGDKTTFVEQSIKRGTPYLPFDEVASLIDVNLLPLSILEAYGHDER